MTTTFLGAFGGVVAFALVVSVWFRGADAASVISAWVDARRGLHRPTAASWGMCQGSPRVRRATPAWSHRKGRM